MPAGENSASTERSPVGARSPAELRPAAFIDRDGTIIEERHYLADPEGVRLLPGAADGLRRLAEGGYRLVVVTNQSGIGRGYFGEAEYRAVEARVAELLQVEGVSLAAVFHCPHAPDAAEPCDCRKPGLGLFRRAAEELGIDLARSVWIGDRLGDVAPAAGLGGFGILVRTGYGAREAETAPPELSVAADLGDAAEAVLGRSIPD